jgi:hypothetical protein
LSSKGRPIRASEIGEYIFCARAWHLRASGLEPTRGYGARRAGREWHLEHGRNVRRASRLRALANAFMVLAFLITLVLLFLWWRG